MHGYHGHCHRIDLTESDLTTRAIPDDVLRQTIGGVGLATHLLAENTPTGLDPFEPAAAVVVATSPLVGTPLTTSAKFAVVGKSPLTNRLSDSLSSSRFAILAKQTGADALVLVGQAPAWSVAVIDDGRLTLMPADSLVGLSAGQTEARVKQWLGPGVAVLAIGPAGERLVRYATVSHDGRHAGRGGMGAVFGGKRLKALAVRGSKRVKLADPSRVTRLARDLADRSLGPATAKYRELGTVANLLTFNRLATLPTRNFQQATFEHAEQLAGEALAQLPGALQRSCAACTIGCEKLFPVEEDGTQHLVRLEYETLFALGSLCGIGDRDVVLRAARRCDEVGIDTISFGGTYAFAAECAERGWWDWPHLGTPRFGDGNALLAAIDAIGSGNGLGPVLAQGSRRLAEEIGRDSIDFAPQVKGLELPGYEPRTLQMMALGFAVGTRGADHNRSAAYEVDFSGGSNRFAADAGEVHRAIAAEDRAALLDSLILCKFLRGVFDDVFAAGAEMLTAITGCPRTGDDLRECAANIVLAKRAYNQREGWTRAEDTLPRRFLETPMEVASGPNAVLGRERLERLIDAYYRLRGLTPTGLAISSPSRRTTLR